MGFLVEVKNLIAKTVIMHIGQNNPYHVYIMNSTNIRSLDSVKDLGVHVSKNLSWSLHAKIFLNELVKCQM